MTDVDKLIAMIVDRDTPPDNRDEVVDWDMVGNPITRGQVEAWAKARDQASQDGAAGGGNG